MMRASTYRAKDGEANFSRPIATQVVGGTHVTLELITKQGSTFFVTVWPNGLPRHEDPPNAIRFPHGLIRFGETLEQCAARLVEDQLGMTVEHVIPIYLDSYVDDKNHWHIEPGCLVEVGGEPKTPAEASEIVPFSLDQMPEFTFYKHDQFLDILRKAARLCTLLQDVDIPPPE